MKRTLYVLIVLFATTFNVNADNNANFESDFIQSDPCDPSDLIFGPISITQGAPPNCADYTFSVHSVLGCWWTTLNGFYTFVVTDASGATIGFVPNTPDTTTSVTLPSYGQYFVHVQYSYVDVNGVGQSVTVATDFYYDGCETPCPPSSLSLGPISIVQGPTTHCSDFILTAPVTGCPWTSVNGYYKFLVYESTNMTYPVAGHLHSLSNSIEIKLGFEGTYIVMVEFHYTDINGIAHTLSETVNFLFENCDCSYIDPPTITDCEVGPSGVTVGTTVLNATQFSWTEPNNAAGYEYEAIMGHPSCCPEGGSLYTFSGPISRFSRLSFIGAPCFTFRIRAVCANGTTKSEWTDWVCSCSLDDLVQEEPREKSSVQIEEIGLQFMAAPNPAKDYVEITVSGIPHEKPLIQPEIVIYDASGIEVYRSSVVLYEAKRIDLRFLKSGMYMISLIDGGTVLSTEKLVVQ